MRFLRRLFGFIIICVVLFLAGDYLNFPLWPVDWLKTRIPIEINVSLVNCSPEEEIQLFRATDSVQLEILSTSGTLVQVLASDKSGVSRTVLPEGEFVVRGSLVTVLNGEFFQYTSPVQQSKVNSQGDMIRGTVLSFSRGSQNGQINLMREREISQESLQQLLQLYLKEGDLQSALVVAGDLGPGVFEDIENLILLNDELSTLQVSAYNSVMDRLNRMISLIENHCADCIAPRIRSGSSHLYLESRLKAVHESRDNVIQSYVDLMDEFISSDRMEAALEEWNQLMSNPELIDPVWDGDGNLPEDLIRLEDVIMEYQELLPDEIHGTFETCVSVYESGEIQKARLLFTRFLRQLRNLSLHEEYANLESDAHAYLDDIALISKANDAIRKDKLEYALELLDIVLNTNTLVDQRIEEATFLLRMRTRPEEKESTP